MKSLFNSSDNGEIIQRINTLTSTTQSQWGKMDVAQMLAHTNVGLKSAFGDVKLQRSLLGMLFGRIAKKQILGDKPFSHNSPTDKNFVIVDQRNFDEEKRTLIGLVQRFAKLGPAGLSKDPHPFFGPMTTDEWDTLMWKHLDHHLRQFGA